jgi:hypothetical protein
VIAVAAPKRARPREFVEVRRLGLRDMTAIAHLRLLHPGGVPTFVPPYWAGAFFDTRLIACAGWIEVDATRRLVCEVDRIPGRWGDVGILCVIRKMQAEAEASGCKLQALVMPGNWRLKRALRQFGADCIAEIWEKP